MGERRDLRELLKDTDFTQKRIIDDLANSDPEAYSPGRGVAGDIRRSEGRDFIKNIFVGFLLVGIVVGSFWISFLVGKRVLVPPVRNLPTLETAPLKAISKLDIERAVPVKEEPVIKEREIKAVEVKAKLPPPVAVKKIMTAKKIGAARTPVKTAVVKPAVKAPAEKTVSAKYYKVIAGTYKTAAEVNKVIKSLKEKGFRSYVKKISGLYRVQVGAFDESDKADPLVVQLKEKGFTPTIIIE
ncbi:MAG: SPOR domain-containing protein [bacterium]